MYKTNHNPRSPSINEKHVTNVSPSFKERFKIYNSTQPKTASITSEEHRRNPTKAVTVRMAPSHRTVAKYSLSPIKSSMRETDQRPLPSPTSKTESTRIEKFGYLSAKDYDFTEGDDEVLAVDREKIRNTFFSGGRARNLVRGSWSLKNLFQEQRDASPLLAEQRQVGRLDNQSYVNDVMPEAMSKVLFRRNKKHLTATLNKPRLIMDEDEEDVYMHNFNGMGANKRVPPIDSPADEYNMDLTRNYPLNKTVGEDSLATKSRPSTALGSALINIVVPRTSATIPVSMRNKSKYLAKHQQMKSDMKYEPNDYENIRIEGVKKGAVQDIKRLLAEKEVSKYQDMQEQLEGYNKVPRYYYNTKARTITTQVPPEESPSRKKAEIDPSSNFKRASMGSKLTDDLINKAISDAYKIDKILGQGAYAIVRSVTDKNTELQYALKTYIKIRLIDVQRKESVKREISVLETLDHPTVIKLYKTIDTPQQLHLLMELGGNQSLQSYIKSKPQMKIPENEAKVIFRQLAEGLGYIHLNNIAHRDLKLDNILIDSEKNIKIIDFGFSLFTAKNKTLNSFCGTPSYMAPELASKKNYFGHLVDIWALGVVLYVLLCGQFPFKGVDNKELFNKIIRGQYLIPDSLSAEARVLLKKLLRLNPHERPTPKEILNERWLTGSDQSQPNFKDFLNNRIEEYRNLKQTL